MSRPDVATRRSLTALDKASIIKPNDTSSYQATREGQARLQNKREHEDFPDLPAH